MPRGRPVNPNSKRQKMLQSRPRTPRKVDSNRELTPEKEETLNWIYGCLRSIQDRYGTRASSDNDFANSCGKPGIKVCKILGDGRAEGQSKREKRD